MSRSSIIIPGWCLDLIDQNPSQEIWLSDNRPHKATSPLSEANYQDVDRPDVTKLHPSWHMEEVSASNSCLDWSEQKEKEDRSMKCQCWAVNSGQVGRYLVGGGTTPDVVASDRCDQHYFSLSGKTSSVAHKQRSGRSVDWKKSFGGNSWSVGEEQSSVAWVYSCNGSDSTRLTLDYVHGRGAASVHVSRIRLV